MVRQNPDVIVAPYTPPALAAKRATSTIPIVFPMQLQIGDKLSDETGQWEVVGRPHTTGGGKKTEARVQRADKPGLTETRTWGSYEKVMVLRRAAQEGKR